MPVGKRVNGIHDIIGVDRIQRRNFRVLVRLKRVDNHNGIRVVCADDCKHALGIGPQHIVPHIRITAQIRNAPLRYLLRGKPRIGFSAARLVIKLIKYIFIRGEFFGKAFKEHRRIVCENARVCPGIFRVRVARALFIAMPIQDNIQPDLGGIFEEEIHVLQNLRLRFGGILTKIQRNQPQPDAVNPEIVAQPFQLLIRGEKLMIRLARRIGIGKQMHTAHHNAFPEAIDQSVPGDGKRPVQPERALINQPIQAGIANGNAVKRNMGLARCLRNVLINKRNFRLLLRFMFDRSACTAVDTDPAPVAIKQNRTVFKLYYIIGVLCAVRCKIIGCIQRKHTTVRSIRRADEDGKALR